MGKHGKLQIIDIRSLESKSEHFSIFSGAFTPCKASYLLRKLAIDKIMDNIIQMEENHQHVNSTPFSHD